LNNIPQNIQNIKSQIGENCTLVAVSKTYPAETIIQAYNAGQRVFGENRVQELLSKKDLLPNDIQWHLIGHLQSNKIKYIIDFVSLIHSVDSEKLLQAIDKEAAKINIIMPCLLQIYIANEDTKFGLDETELYHILDNLNQFKHIQIAGLMGMATNTSDQEKIKSEFEFLNDLYTQVKTKYFPNETTFRHVSMGMSSDYKLAVACGSNMIRVGSLIFS